MSETPDEPVRSGDPVRPDRPARKPVRWSRVATVTGSVLLTGAVVAGLAFTAVTVNGADRDPGAPSWKFPETAADAEKGSAPQSLAGMLVPYGDDGWLRGPDLGEFGSDTQLGAARATALQKEALRDLPRSRRLRLEKEIDRWRITGMAMRSYVSGSVSLYQETDLYTVGVVLTRLENRAAVRDLARFRSEFPDLLDGFPGSRDDSREGPRIKGHENARCVLPPEDPEDEDQAIDTMSCSAHVGDVLVTLTAKGAKPLDTEGVATLLREQLDRITEPGKAV